MRKSFKKLLAVGTAAVLTVGALSLAACAPSHTAPAGIPNGEASSNGGFVVSVEDSTTGGYYYFINGKEEYTANNTYGAPVKGALMRVKKSDLSSAETVIPSLMVAGDYEAGIFIYGDRVYYATPTNVHDITGTVGNSYLEFKSAKLDGTDIKDICRLESNTMPYRFVEVDGTVYALYVEGSSTYTIHSVNTETREDTVLVENATSYAFDAEDKENPTVYYTMNVTNKADSDYAQTFLYNQIYRVQADATEVPAGYAYGEEDFWDWDYINDHSETFEDGKAPYNNLGELVLDGIGTNDPKTAFNQSSSEPLTPLGYSYGIRSYKNGGIYFVRQEMSAFGGDLYFLDESKVTASWDSINANKTGTGSKLDRIANDVEVENKATDTAYFYKEADGHHYLYVKDDVLYRKDVATGYEQAIAYQVGAPTILGIDSTSNSTYHYVYFTRSNGDGLSVERAVYNGSPENYKNLTFNGTDNAGYKPTKLLNLQHVSDWYEYEIIDNTVFYVDAEVFGAQAYNYVSCVDLTKNGKAMTNVEIEALNEKYESIANRENKEIGLFAKLTDIMDDTNLLNALRYYFYTGERTQFDENIAEAIANGEESDFLYTEQEKEAFEAFLGNKGFTIEKEEIFSANDYKDEAGNYYRTYDYFRTQIGKMSEEDANSLAKYWRTNLQYYQATETQEEGLAWWAWLLISLAITAVVATGAGFAVWFFLLRKKAAEEEAPVERMEVITADDSEVDVYATEAPEAEAEQESAEQLEEPAETLVVEEEPAEAEGEPETPTEE